MENYFAMHMTLAQVNEISNLGLAHIGDGVYELLCRAYLCDKGGKKVNNLHKNTVKLVNAVTQAKVADKLLPVLSEEELVLLINRYPKDYQEKIERLSKYMADTGRSYASHYDTIVEWAEKDAQKETKAAEGTDNGLKSFDSDDFFQAAMKKSYRDLNGGSE